MRNLILSISILCLALSGFITFKALSLPGGKQRNSTIEPSLKTQQSAQRIKGPVPEPTGEQDSRSDLNQTLQNTISQLEQRMAEQIAASQKNIQSLEDTVKQLEQKLADKIADAQTDTRATVRTTAQLEQKIADEIAASQENIQTLENTVILLEQKLADKSAAAQTDTRTTERTTAQLEQKMAAKIVASQENIQTLENTVILLEQKLADKSADSQTDTRSAENTKKPSGRLLFEVNFRPGNFIMSTEITKLIQKTTQDILSMPPNYRVIVEGHTDSIPIKIAPGQRSLITDNMSLSLFRAKTIASMFEDEGIPSQRIEAIGYGATHPIAPNNTAEGRAKNRRVVVRIIPE